MTAREVTEVCANLRAMLGGAVGHHPRLPSLALLERALVKNGERGIDDVPAAVLRHAAQALDAFDLDRYGPGLVLLRRRIEQVLRRRHGDRHTQAGHSQPDQPTERLAAAMAPGALKDFSDSMTEFIDIDQMFGDSQAPDRTRTPMKKGRNRGPSSFRRRSAPPELQRFTARRPSASSARAS